MDHLKSPGLDGFRASFYQKHWKIVGIEVTEAALSILNNESMISPIKSNFLALISKKFNASLVSNFRLNSLCNTLYKHVSKTITNRFKPIMDSIICGNQSAFVLGWLIFNNIIIVHELLHSLKKHKKGKVRKMVVKLDMSKVYDRVEWSYIEAVMKALSFQEKWIKLIMACISSFSFSTLINGSSSKHFFPLRGLR